MLQTNRNRPVLSLAVALCLAGCAGTETLVDAPSVSLSGVRLQAANLRSQTFLLEFDVGNPNPFPLPVRAFDYRVMLDDHRFAGGEATGRFSVPARGEETVTISVDVDMLSSATQIASLVQGGVPDRVSYALEGALTVDIPFTRPLPFSSSGIIDVQGAAY